MNLHNSISDIRIQKQWFQKEKIVELSLSDKVKFIKASNGQSVRKLDDQFKCGKSTSNAYLHKH